MKFKIGDLIICKENGCVGFKRKGKIREFTMEADGLAAKFGFNWDYVSHLEKVNPVGRPRKAYAVTPTGIKALAQDYVNEQILEELKKLNEKLDRVFK